MSSTCVVTKGGCFGPVDPLNLEAEVCGVAPARVFRGHEDWVEALLVTRGEEDAPEDGERGVITAGAGGNVILWELDAEQNCDVFVARVRGRGVVVRAWGAEGGGRRAGAGLEGSSGRYQGMVR